MGIFWFICEEFSAVLLRMLNKNNGFNEIYKSKFFKHNKKKKVHQCLCICSLSWSIICFNSVTVRCRSSTYPHLILYLILFALLSVSICTCTYIHVFFRFSCWNKEIAYRCTYIVNKIELVIFPLLLAFYWSKHFPFLYLYLL